MKQNKPHSYCHISFETNNIYEFVFINIDEKKSRFKRLMIAIFEQTLQLSE